MAIVLVLVLVRVMRDDGWLRIYGATRQRSPPTQRYEGTHQVCEAAHSQSAASVPSHGRLWHCAPRKATRVRFTDMTTVRVQQVAYHLARWSLLGARSPPPRSSITLGFKAGLPPPRPGWSPPHHTTPHRYGFRARKLFVSRAQLAWGSHRGHDKGMVRVRVRPDCGER